MQLIVLISLMLLSSENSFAKPKVGDHAIYNFRDEMQGEITIGQRIQEVMKVLGDKIVVRTTTVDSSSGSSWSIEREVTPEGWEFLESVRSLNRHCAQHRGRRFKMRVGDTNIEVCESNIFESGRLIFGIVPFGIVEKIFTMPELSKATVLTDFSHGQ